MSEYARGRIKELTEKLLENTKRINEILDEDNKSRDMGTRYNVGDRVVVTNTESELRGRFGGTITYVQSENVAEGSNYVNKVSYEIDLDNGNFIMVTDDNDWYILYPIIKETTLEERISTIEERLGVLDNHVKKYIVDKVEKDVLIDTGAFCSPLVEIVDGKDCMYYLFENGTYAKCIM